MADADIATSASVAPLHAVVVAPWPGDTDRDAYEIGQFVAWTRDGLCVAADHDTMAEHPAVAAALQRIGDHANRLDLDSVDLTPHGAFHTDVEELVHTRDFKLDRVIAHEYGTLADADRLRSGAPHPHSRSLHPDVAADAQTYQQRIDDVAAATTRLHQALADIDAATANQILRRRNPDHQDLPDTTAQATLAQHVLPSRSRWTFYGATS